MATLETVQAKIRALQAQAETLIAKKSSAALKAIRDLMSEHGLTTDDIEKHSVQSKVDSKVRLKQATKASSPAVKYRDSRTGKTWSGHGRAPSWIVDAKDRSKYLADGVANTASPVVKDLSGAVRKGPPKGPQPALYRDPKTGLTWSGRGPAPAWLASAKDRAVFLIDQNVEVADETGGKANAAAKKAVVRKNALASKTVTAKKAPTKTSTKFVAKKVAGEKTAAKKTAAKKTAAKKTAAKKTAAKKTVKKATAKNVTTRKAATKNVSGKSRIAKSSEGASAATPSGADANTSDVAASK